MKYIGAAVKMKSVSGKNMHGQVRKHFFLLTKYDTLHSYTLIAVSKQRKLAGTTGQETEYTSLSNIEGIM